VHYDPRGRQERERLRKMDRYELRQVRHVGKIGLLLLCGPERIRRKSGSELHILQ